jgi:predicted nucleic acid-binding protein
MRGVFADTFYFLALGNRSDQAYSMALSVSQRLTAPLVTTTWVLTEFADACAAPNQRVAFLVWLRTLQADPKVTIVPASQALFERGIELYSKRLDKSWSLTDCISFTVMNDYQIVEALTGDHHFEQAGFRALLK